MKSKKPDVDAATKEKDEVIELVSEALGKRGFARVKAVVEEFGVRKVNDVNPSDYPALKRRLTEIMGVTIAAYAYNSTVPAAPYHTIDGAAIVVRSPGEPDKLVRVCYPDGPINSAEPYEAMAKHYEGVKYPDAPRNTAFAQEVRAPYGGLPEMDTTGEQFESLKRSVRPHAQKDNVDHLSRQMTLYTIGLPGDLHHETTKLVLDTANLMGQKLMAAQKKYGFKNGWQDTEWEKPKEGAIFDAAQPCREHAFNHLLKGDPVDVLNYMAFMMHHGWSCAPQTRDEAKKMVAMLQQKFDLVDDTAVLATLINNMEDRHGEEFNQFFEATLRRVMLDNGLKRVVIKAADMLQDFGTVKFVELSEEPGLLVYSLTGDDLNA